MKNKNRKKFTKEKIKSLLKDIKFCYWMAFVFYIITLSNVSEPIYGDFKPLFFGNLLAFSVLFIGMAAMNFLIIWFLGRLKN
ncbi:hypothetical protein AAGG74_17595 [Bacillus mexicanus]|uniref:hypothetical protein n=1 Tax=Bacillus mexicanus TaxID=2834415 RepID=UPI003D1FC3B9